MTRPSAPSARAKVRRLRELARYDRSSVNAILDELPLGRDSRQRRKVAGEGKKNVSPRNLRSPADSAGRH
ncbi:MAG: hypothetical protein QGH58_07555 [Arenicellales bacterium]|nr:hypothetical protein [Arenicellales bacterium]MDP6791752.1 hypothetical protein [Arenicellales bacterium]MDP6919423.1 hypothetical protein [Arenicellales bacterium]